MQRVCQQRLPFGLRFGDQRTAVRDGDKASGHLVDDAIPPAPRLSPLFTELVAGFAG